MRFSTSGFFHYKIAWVPDPQVRADSNSPIFDFEMVLFWSAVTMTPLITKKIDFKIENLCENEAMARQKRFHSWIGSPDGLVR
jgi:hypothetical protein